ncbi:hypothetical protein A2U01_0003569 [Trifolium medium]|uniref:Uncharacterized protein n=1 Tax=Trifolium medium TaxID=97028 RepID=A0A392M7K9_9FABA|nr:hypothetical protein [Trifolium medium]
MHSRSIGPIYICKRCLVFGERQHGAMCSFQEAFIAVMYYVRIDVEADDKLPMVEKLVATGECGIDPFIDHLAGHNYGDGNLGFVKVDEYIAIVGNLLTVDDDCHFFYVTS